MLGLVQTEELVGLCGDKMGFVAVARDLQESIRSLSPMEQVCAGLEDESLVRRRNPSQQVAFLVRDVGARLRAGRLRSERFDHLDQ